MSKRKVNENIGYIDLTGKKFNKLLVIKRAGVNRDGKALWECLCDCGKTTVTFSYRLKSGKTASCGCLQTEALIRRNTIHGFATVGHKCSEFNTWMNIKQRCYNPKNDRYTDWGGRGIKVCRRWLGKNGFINFMADMGPKPSKNHSIDRIDNDGNYTSSNCKWSTRKEQASNTSKNRWLSHNGTTMILTDWAKSLKCQESGIQYFLKKGKTMDWIVNHYKYEKRKSPNFNRRLHVS
jgi:hypothetical protein